jgi:hypothetical protein
MQVHNGIEPRATGCRGHLPDPGDDPGTVWCRGNSGNSAALCTSTVLLRLSLCSFAFSTRTVSPLRREVHRSNPLTLRTHSCSCRCITAVWAAAMA